ncbi:MAG: hypothetical protein K5798_09535 [Nitrosopumilus sp.]|uniref:hypothetical protein n=1 Tax=Nitrosopumilus sp. TaxID=2024843 RepID=UPI00242A40E4|nr:hypothetical protein [Nitrosopumilus sp.]MCV0367485.1 hypothetical protein [Nitrosopumilus sp.]
MSDIQIYLDSLAITGILFEIAGFWWLLKYTPTTKIEEYQEWMKKHSQPGNVKMVKFDMEELYEGFYRKREFEVPEKFADSRNNAKDGAIRLVIVGLVLQIIQIFGNDIVSIFA